jgi:hypothetical protein
MRIAPHLSANWHPYWRDLSAPSAANALLDYVTRSFMHGRLWLNAPGRMPVETGRTRSQLTLNEMRMLTTVTGLMGSLASDGDSLALMRQDGLEHLRRVLPPYDRSAVPMDLFRHELPQTLILPVETDWGSWMVVGLLNWEDQSRVTKITLSHLGLPPAAYHVYNYWRQRYLGVFRDEIIINPHQRHEAVLLLVKPVSDQPQVLSSTFHVVQGAVEIADVRLCSDKLVVDMEKPGRQFGRLAFAVPPDQRVIGATISGRSQKPQQISADIWQLGFSLNEKATVDLLFE